MRGRRKGGQMAAFPITVAGPLASNAQPATAARQQAAQNARTARKSAAARPTAHATRQSGPDGSSLVAQLRDRHGRRRSQPPNQPREIALRPVRGRLSCPAGQPKVPTSIRSLCTGWFRASNVITDTVRFERSSAARGSAVARKAETIGFGGHGPPSSADSGNGWLQTPRNPGAGSRNGRFHDRIHVRLGRRLEPETRTDWTLWRKPAERMYHDAPDTTCCLPHDTRRQVSTSGHLHTNPARNSWNSRPGSGPGIRLACRPRRPHVQGRSQPVVTSSGSADPTTLGIGNSSNGAFQQRNDVCRAPKAARAETHPTRLRRSRPSGCPTTCGIGLAVFADHTVRQVTTSGHLHADRADIWLAAPNLGGNPPLTPDAPWRRSCEFSPEPHREVDDETEVGEATHGWTERIKTGSSPGRGAGVERPAGSRCTAAGRTNARTANPRRHDRRRRRGRRRNG